ncbi:DUF924 family protein [Pseudomonas chlororaphis]|uniref:DUF924 family protein n=1 Tax=Pseudomonas chlororaphis subsp. aurantiaca TaxID=86192 RepID=A0AAJ0ZHN2_9PSED|nr:DUF924 family protein [Pseudomonas chlororaphis]MBU4632684.1 DUF924 family protein [Pseudomonas chlororaphis subsp. aurantiaca]
MLMAFINDKQAAAVVRFWREAGASQWFAKDPVFDQRFRELFLDRHRAVVRGEYEVWRNTPEGSLALLILLDQFPRNAFRGSADMYATDVLARHFARLAQAAGHMEAVAADLRLFFCLPFAHSEDLIDQDFSVLLNARLGQPWLAHAEGHRDVIRRFGRFPHRNRLLGRESTPEEERFLEEGGFAG